MSPLNARLSTMPSTILLGSWPRNRLLCVKLFRPCGRWITLHSTCVIGYFAVFCWRMRSCARQRHGVIYNFLTNNFVYNMSTLKDPVTSLLAMRTNKSLLCVILTFIVTPFNIYFLRLNTSTCSEPIILNVGFAVHIPCLLLSPVFLAEYESGIGLVTVMLSSIKYIAA